MRRSLLALGFVFSLVFSGSSAMADATIDSAWNQAYEAVLQNPGNPALNKEYLDLCIARGDYEAAIPAIERLLAQQPGDAALTLKLGEMYRKLGSHKVAQNYFTSVKNNPAVSASLRAEADSLSQQ